MVKTPKKRHWTVLVYLAGDNNLDGAGVVDLGEMKKVEELKTLRALRVPFGQGFLLCRPMPIADIEEGRRLPV